REVLVPAEFLQHAKGELGIAVLDLRTNGVRAFGKKIIVIFPLHLLPVLHHLALHDALDSEPRAEGAAALLHRKVGIVEDRRAWMPVLGRAPARPWQAVII